MSAPNPQVSVFHFTSRISSAKIRKYKLATERGMSSGSGDTTAPTSTSNTVEARSSRLTDSTTMEPPAKRPRLKLNVRRPSDSQDSIAVARPKRDAPLRIRYSENMVIDSEDLVEEDEPITVGRSRPSPAASSDLSSLTSAPSVEKDPTPAKETETSAAKRPDYSRDFMSYYVDGGDDDREEKEASPPPEIVPPKPDPPKQALVPAVPDTHTTNGTTKHREQPPTHPTTRMRTSLPRATLPQPTLPQPKVTVIDPAANPSIMSGPDTVANMVWKLEKLSNALTNFGGIPALPESPRLLSKDHPEQQLTGEKKDVDNFLAMFEDDDSDEKDEQEVKPNKETRDLNHILESPGQLDGPLTYGIQFIQNALRSWAVQRTTAQLNQQWMHEHQAWLESQPNKRGPGRPRKFDTDYEDSRPPPPPAHIRINLGQTPEGAAIVAFQDVLNSGCLQVNAKLPVELSRALRRLYMQIDHLINQGSRHEPQWQCMSYGAQISAQRIRVEKRKVAHAKAQQEMIRQQHIAHQQIMQQMGIPEHMTEAQVQKQHAMDLEHKRSLRDAAQQPHLTQYLSNPLRLNGQQESAPAEYAALASEVNNVSTNSPADVAPNDPARIPHGLPLPSNSTDGKGVHLDKIKLYMPNFLPRSGQSMKFSFAPHNELALQTFGAQAFPTGHTGQNLPNRGPMSANPSMNLSHAHNHSPNGRIPTPVVPSNGPGPAEAEDEEVQVVASVDKAQVQPKSIDLNVHKKRSAVLNGSEHNSEYKTAASLDVGDHYSSIPTTAHNSVGPSTKSSEQSHTLASTSSAMSGDIGVIRENGKDVALHAGVPQTEIMVIDS